AMTLKPEGEGKSPDQIWHPGIRKLAETLLSLLHGKKPKIRNPEILKAARSACQKYLDTERSLAAEYAAKAQERSLSTASPSDIEQLYTNWWYGQNDTRIGGLGRNSQQPPPSLDRLLLEDWYAKNDRGR